MGNIRQIAAPRGAERLTEAVTGVEAVELSLARGRGGPLSGKAKTRVRPLLGKPAKIPYKAASPPA
ncbi:MAG: hypothetical protein LBH50_00530 [Spirochaetaceae bacterium]|nr:hypothetical protein [Spirochaetaceae bacterium]